MLLTPIFLYRCRTISSVMFEDPEWMLKDSKRLTPDSLLCISRCGMTYFSCVLCLVFFPAVFWFIPFLYNNDSLAWWSSMILSLFLMINVCVNFVFVVMRQGHCFPVVNAPSSWKMCYDCEYLVPTNAHHCILCHRCVVLRDHHCFFTGSCVCRSNQRYFIIYCFYCGFGSLYGLILALRYVHMTIPEWSLYEYLPFVSFFEWLFGYITFEVFFLSVLLFTSFITILGSLGIGALQFVCVFLNTNSFTIMKPSANLSFNFLAGLHRLHKVFGKFWFVVVVFPIDLFITQKPFDLHIHKHV